MRAIRVDFREPRRIPAWLLVAALAVSGGALGWQLWQLWRVEAELRSTTTELAGLKAQIEEGNAKRKEQDEARARAAQTPEARLQEKIRAFPLNDVLTSIETAKMDGVRLMLLDISASEGVARIECEYDNSETVFRYLERLNAGGHGRWELTSLRAKTDGSVGGAASILSK